MPAESPASPTPSILTGYVGGVVSWWRWILLGWLLVAVLARVLSPSWNEVALDGDFEYLPAGYASVRGGKLLDEAFPEERSRSQIALVVAREERPIEEADEYVALDASRRLYHRLAEVSLQRAMEAGWDFRGPPATDLAERRVQRAREALDESIRADERYYQYFGETLPPREPSATYPRWALAYLDRAHLRAALGEASGAAEDLRAARQLDADIESRRPPIPQRELSAWSGLIDVLTWDDPVIGHRLRRGGARLILLRLDTELAATGNIATFESVTDLVDDVLDRHASLIQPGLEILPAGSAAIGGETLRAAREAIRYTELFTVLLIVLILSVVYRAPLLVAVPLLSIAVAAVTATGLVASLAWLAREPGFEWLQLKVFTTTKIFVVVILFGAGTDYCLFLIARLREEAATRPWDEAVAHSLRRVGRALLGSALTTVVGLGMLWFADFGKFQYTGPVIALSLLIALLVCTTLTPALLYACGPRVFWPGRPGRSGWRRGDRFWRRLALAISRYPRTFLITGLLALMAPALYGMANEAGVSYDLSRQLGPAAESLRGTAILNRRLPAGEMNPATLLVVRNQAIDSRQLADEVRELARELYQLPGVEAVRSIHDPLGDYPPGVRMGMFERSAWRRRALQTHRISQSYFLSDEDRYRDRLVRLDVVFAGDPFELETGRAVEAMYQWVVAETARPDSPWTDAEVAMAGTTPSINDLRAVTLADQTRIKWAVVSAVLVVLLLVVRRVGLSLYLIATVLLSYFATLGLTVLFFRAAYGDSYVGLDWKVPVFLFVILVAVGQDYNVYLVTRVAEEQRRGRPLAGLRRALTRTGGIITSCGVVMAGTFFSMTASAWAPPLLAALGLGADAAATLRGVVELGFALGLGVLIDTLYVRSILVPAFIAAVDSRRPDCIGLARRYNTQSDRGPESRAAAAPLPHRLR